ncbi:MAG: hypothetical protein H6968_11610 [Chromatiaceae bacterium]|nr:hypothetical protein [Chromatiaceae bacterium]
MKFRQSFRTRGGRFKVPPEESHQPFRPLALLLMLMLGIVGLAHAAVRDTIITDVSTRAFSVVWVSDAAVTDATVRVFADAAGDFEITSSLNVVVESASIASAHSLGIVKVDVQGLQADTTYYVETETNTLVFPAADDPLLDVTTAATTTVSNPDGTPITNDLIVHEIFEPDGVTPADGALLVLQIPSISQYPLTAFVADGIETPGAMVDLSNIVSDATGTNAQVTGDTVIQINEYRGAICASLDDQKLLRLRRAPTHEETPSISEAEISAPCFSPFGLAADFNCDARIGAGDLNLFLSKYGLSSTEAEPDCRFNEDYDLNADRRVGAGDLNLFLSVFGVTE